MTTKQMKPHQKSPKDAIEFLMAEHETVRGLLRQFTKATQDKRRIELLARIEKEIKIHTQIEEEIFYPAYQEACKTKKDLKLFYEAHEEHHVADQVINALKKTTISSEQFAAKAKVLMDLVEHHAEEEETQMFPASQKLINQEGLLELGELLEERKLALSKKYCS